MASAQLAVGNDLRSYWQSIESLDLTAKADLMTMLVKSIAESARSAASHDERNNVLQFAGFWKDDRTTEEIIADIRESRTPNRDCEAFDD